MTPEEKLALIKINAFNYLRTDWLERLLEIFGTGQEILKQTPQTLSEEGKISLETAEYFLKSAYSVCNSAEFTHFSYSISSPFAFSKL